MLAAVVFLTLGVLGVIVGAVYSWWAMVVLIGVAVVAAGIVARRADEQAWRLEPGLVTYRCGADESAYELNEVVAVTTPPLEGLAAVYFELRGDRLLNVPPNAQHFLRAVGEELRRLNVELRTDRTSRSLLGLPEKPDTGTAQ